MSGISSDRHPYELQPLSRRPGRFAPREGEGEFALVDPHKEFSLKEGPLVASPTEVLLDFCRSELWRADIGARLWSTAYHFSFGTAGILGIVVGAISQATFATFRGVSKNTLISAMSILAAVLTFVGGFGGFEAKWQANRAYRVALQQIALDLRMPTPDIKEIRERIRAAAEQNNSIRLRAESGEPAAPGK